MVENEKNYQVFPNCKVSRIRKFLHYSEIAKDQRNATQYFNLTWHTIFFLYDKSSVCDSWYLLV